MLAPGDVLVISTPNAAFTMPVNGKPKNPFHVHEYTAGKLGDALESRFGAVELRGQVLHPRFAVSPFWDEQQRLPGTLPAQSRLFAWRVLNKLPSRLRDTASRALRGHPLIPSEYDYEFGPVHDEAPVLVAICCAAGPTR